LLPALQTSKSQDFRTIVDRLSDIVCKLEFELERQMEAEFSVLVDILHKPHVLFRSFSEADIKCRSGAFLAKLISHCKGLSRDMHQNKEASNLCIRLLQTLRKMVHQETFSHGLPAEIRQIVLNRFLGPLALCQEPGGDGDASTWPIEEVQNRMNSAGASVLIVDILITNPSYKIFKECIQLAKALLEDGNEQVQTTLLKRLSQDSTAEKFFKNLTERFEMAQNKLRSSGPMATDLMAAGRRTPSGSNTPRKVSSSSCLCPATPSPFMSTVSSTAPGSSTMTSGPGQLTATGIWGLLMRGRPRLLRTLTREYGGSMGAPHANGGLFGVGGRSSGPTGDSSSTPQHATEDDVRSAGLSAQTAAATPAAGEHSGASGVGGGGSQQQQLWPEIDVMEPILRFLQLLCENHNGALQNFLRNQGNKTNYDMVNTTLTFLDSLCGSTTGSLGLLGLYINVRNVGLVNQTLITLTEFCQGPCHENQNAIAAHEANGLDMVISLVLNEIRPLADYRMDLVMEVKSNASKLLLAIMESRHDSETAERILNNMNRMEGGPSHLISAIKQAYSPAAVQVSDSEPTSLFSLGEFSMQQISGSRSDNNMHQPQQNTSTAASIEVGHNIYILAHQLGKHNRDLSVAMSGDRSPALAYYAQHTAEIEIVRSEGVLEKIVFPVPTLCSYLTSQTRLRVFHDAECDDQGSKLADFYSRVDDMYKEMLWQRQLRRQRFLDWCSRNALFWSRLSYSFALVVNMLVAFYYPFDKSADLIPSFSSSLVLLVLLSGLFCLCLPRDHAAIVSGMYIAIRLLLVLGLRPALFILGLAQLSNKVLHIISYMGNRGTFHMSFSEIMADSEFLLLLFYLVFCGLGFLGANLFYCVLLLDVVTREETLRNVIKSVTRNWRSIVLTGILALIEVYIFAIVGFLLFSADYVQERDAPLEVTSGRHHILPSWLHSLLHWPHGSNTSNLTAGFPGRTAALNGSGNVSYLSALNASHIDNQGTCTSDNCTFVIQTAGAGASDIDADKMLVCHTLWGCLIETVNCGLRSGGGIGDCLRKRAPDEELFMLRVLYDIAFFFIIITITLNLIFGVIIDTFADLRSEKQEKDETLKNTCFICGLNRGAFDNKTITFEEHVSSEHYIWNYLYFMILLKVKPQTEFTGPESYVFDKLQSGKTSTLDWFPRLRAMSLTLEEDTSGEQHDIRALHGLLQDTLAEVKTLSTQLNTLRQQMNQQRNRRERNQIIHNTSMGRNFSH
jgi:hypothetical protein